MHGRRHSAMRPTLLLGWVSAGSLNNLPLRKRGNGRGFVASVFDELPNPSFPKRGVEAAPLK